MHGLQLNCRMQVFVALDEDQDGLLSADEFATCLVRYFDYDRESAGADAQQLQEWVGGRIGMAQFVKLWEYVSTGGEMEDDGNDSWDEEEEERQVCAQQYVGKSQSCMVISGRLIVHAPVCRRTIM